MKREKVEMGFLVLVIGGMALIATLTSNDIGLVPFHIRMAFLIMSVSSLFVGLILGAWLERDNDGQKSNGGIIGDTTPHAEQQPVLGGETPPKDEGLKVLNH